MKKILFILTLMIMSIGVNAQDTIRKGASKEIINYGTVIENNGGTVNITQSGTPRGGVTEIHHEVIVDKTQPSQPEVSNISSDDALAMHAIDAWKSIIIVIAIVGGAVAFIILRNKFKNE